MTKQAAYVSINKLCDKLEEFIKEHDGHELNRAYEYYVIFSKDYVYTDKFDKNYVNLNPSVISLWKWQQLKYKDLCKIFDCKYLYIKVNKKYINQNKKIEYFVIDRNTKKFTNKDGKEITYHEVIKNINNYFLLEEVSSRMNDNYEQFIKDCGL